MKVGGNHEGVQPKVMKTFISMRSVQVMLHKF